MMTDMIIFIVMAICLALDSLRYYGEVRERQKFKNQLGNTYQGMWPDEEEEEWLKRWEGLNGDTL